MAIRTFTSDEDKAGADREEERCIKGMPAKFFVDEIKKQDRICKLNGGKLEDFPIQIPGIGLHSILEKQKVKEEQANGGRATNPKFQY